MRYICSWSGGKDSTASIILAHEMNEPLDTIIFCEVMFDKNNNISGENPQHIDFIWNKAKPLFESWGYEVLILRADKDYLDEFYRIIERPTKHTEHKGMKCGFALKGLCSIKRDCKLKPINDYFKSLNEQYMNYVGICIDEPKRLESLYKIDNQISLLAKYGYTELMAKELCMKYDMLSPGYQLSKRGGCWFCPNAKLAEHAYIKHNMPDVWEKFLSLENESNVANYKWNPFTKDTLTMRNSNIEFEDAQMTIFDYIGEENKWQK